MRLPSPSPSWLVRLLHWRQRRVYGEVLEPTALWSYRPPALFAFLWMGSRLRSRRSPLSAEIRALVSLRVSQITRCSFCIDLNGSMLNEAAATDEKVTSLAGWRDAAVFSEAERAALEYAEAVSATPPQVGEELFARLRRSFTPEAIVELTAVAAFQNMSARFNAALDAQPHGFCPLPPRKEAEPADADPAQPVRARAERADAPRA